MNTLIIICTILLGAQLWRMGGHGQKWARTVAFPALIAISKYLITLNPWAFLYLPAYLLISPIFAYGLNNWNHRLWEKIYGGKGSDGNYQPVERAVRMTWGFGFSLIAISFVWFNAHWWQWGIYSIFMTISSGYFGLVDDVEISERLIGLSTALCILI